MNSTTIAQPAAVSGESPAMPKPKRADMDTDELADAVADVIARSPPPKSPWVTIIVGLVTVASAMGAGNWAVMTRGADDTQAVIASALRDHADKIEARDKAEHDALRQESEHDRDALLAKIEKIEVSTQQTAIDVAVIKASLPR